MVTIARGFAVGAAAGLLTCAAVGLAGAASADPLDGSYTITVTDGHGFLDSGVKQGVLTSSCGPDCTHINGGDFTADLHLQGNTWTGVTTDGSTYSFDKDSLAGTVVNRLGETVDVQWSKAPV